MLITNGQKARFGVKIIIREIIFIKDSENEWELAHIHSRDFFIRSIYKYNFSDK